MWCTASRFPISKVFPAVAQFLEYLCRKTFPEYFILPSWLGKPSVQKKQMSCRHLNNFILKHKKRFIFIILHSLTFINCYKTHIKPYKVKKKKLDSERETKIYTYLNNISATRGGGKGQLRTMSTSHLLFLTDGFSQFIKKKGEAYMSEI